MYIITSYQIVTMQQYSVFNDQRVTLSWPTNAADFTLVTASALASSAVWSPVDMPVVVSNEENRVSVPATNAYQFFRLRR